jgi:hypothetical protein
VKQTLVVLALLALWAIVNTWVRPRGGVPT